MRQRIVSKTRKLYFERKKIATISCFFFSIFLIHAPLFPQAQSNVTAKIIRDSSIDITIHQEINFKVDPQKIYQTLLSSKEFSNCTKKSFSVFSEMSAHIDSAIGGTFSLFDGHIIGRILELVPNKRIVEAWRVVDWPSGIYSIAKFEFNLQGAGTHLIFDQIGFPPGLKEPLSTGWQEHYWHALNNYFQ